MNEEIATTPFGGGRIFARQFLRRKQVTETQAKLSGTGTGTGKTGIDKWQLLRALTEAKAAYELSDRSIVVLEALLSFHPERLLDGSRPLIVFPSNQQLALRTRGMSPATIRRHLAVLVAAGLIFRRDSPNGKRYCRRDATGAPREMFGFDLAPLVLANDTIQTEADRMRDEERVRQGLRGEVTLHLRDIAKLLQAALNEERAGDWHGFAIQLEALSGRVSRNATMASLTERRNALLRLRAELESAYCKTIEAEEMSACVHQFEHHIQNPESDQTHESANEKADHTDRAKTAELVFAESDALPEQSHQKRRETISLPRILNACPQIADYSRNGIGNWSEFMGAVTLVRAMLKISPAGWNTAVAAMGEVQAGIAIAAMLERAEHIRSPGSYLRALAQKAVSGKFAIIPMMRALEQNAEPPVFRGARLV